MKLRYEVRVASTTGPRSSDVVAKVADLNVAVATAAAYGEALTSTGYSRYAEVKIRDLETKIDLT